MKNVTIVFPIRDGGPYLPQLKQQLNSLDYPRDNIRVIAIEGDSIDGTWGLLQQWAIDDKRVTVCKLDTGAQKYGQCTSPARFKHLAGIFNHGLNKVNCEWTDYVLFTPSDIIFGPDILTRLIDCNKQYIAPMYWTNENGHSRFYDTWAYSRGGVNFGPLPKAWYKQRFPSKPFEADTVGGMVLIDADLIAAGARYSPVNVDRGLCEAVKKMGVSVWVNPQAHIYHR